MTMTFNQFRMVLLNEDSSIKEIIYTSDEYNTERELDEALYQYILKANSIYNFTDWENVLPLEIQCKDKFDNEWYYTDDPVDYFYNL